MLENSNKMINEITELVNNTKIGRIIVSNENEYNNRLEYGKEVLKGLSNELTKYIGKGYSVSNLKYMRMFYKAYPEFEKLSNKITWSHYLELMIITDMIKEIFMKKNVLIPIGQ